MPELEAQLAASQHTLNEHRDGAATKVEAPRGWMPVPCEAELLAILTASIEGGAHAGFARMETALKAELAKLSSSDSRLLSQRLRSPHTDDRLAAELGRLVPERRDRVLDYLADSRRRESLHGNVAASAAASTQRATPASPSASVTQQPQPIEERLRSMLETAELDPASLSIGDLRARRALAGRLRRYRPGSGDELGARFARLDRGTQLAVFAALDQETKPISSYETITQATAGMGAPLPFLDQIQRSFGPHDVSRVRAHVDTEARSAADVIDARAFAIGDAVAFADTPTLQLAAHEAAHVIQQRAGVALATSELEDHADAVANAVVAGRSAVPLLDQLQGMGASSSTAIVQRKLTSAPSSKERDNLPDGLDFKPADDGRSARVRRDWILLDPIPHTVEVLKSLQAAGMFPWASPEDLLRAARATRTPSKTSPAILVYTIDVRTLAAMGLPPLASAMIERVGNDLRLAIRADGIPESSIDHTVQLEAANLAAAERALQKHTSLALRGSIPQLAVAVARDVVFLELTDAVLAKLFGRSEWDAWKARPTSTTHDVGVTIARDLTPGEHARLTTWLARTLGITQGVGTQLDREILAIIDEVDRQPFLAPLIRNELQHHAGREARPLDAITLRDAIERAKYQVERERLGLTDPHVDRDAPLADALAQFYVPARIFQHGLVLAGRPTTLELQLDWGAYTSIGHAKEHEEFKKRGWHAEVDWVFERIDGWAKPIDRVQTRHEREGIDLAHTFRLAQGETRGVWTVHAFLRTAQFAPRHITQAIEVKTEAARMADLRDDAMGDMTGGAQTTTAHEFETRFRDDLANQNTLNLPDDVAGTVTRGTLPASYQPHSPAERTAQQHERLETSRLMLAYLRAQQDSGGVGYQEAILAAARRVEHLEKVEHEIASEAASDWESFELRGTYLSHKPGVPSGPLQLYGTARISDGKTEVRIRDMSELLGEDMKFTGKASSFDGAFESAFLDLCKSYPEGRISMMAESLSFEWRGRDASRTGQSIGFELATTSAWSRFKDATYNPAVKLIANIAAAAVMVVFPPSIPVLMPALAVYNTIDSVDELVTRHANGTLTFKRASMTIAEIGLNVLPFASNARLLQEVGGIAKGAQVGRNLRLVAFELGNAAANLLVMTSQVRDEIAEIQEQQVGAMGERYRRLLELEKTTSSSDPALVEMRADIERGAQAIRDTVADRWINAVTNQAVFTIGPHLLGSSGAHNSFGNEAHDAHPNKPHANENARHAPDAHHEPLHVQGHESQHPDHPETGSQSHDHDGARQRIAPKSPHPGDDVHAPDAGHESGHSQQEHSQPTTSHAPAASPHSSQLAEEHGPGSFEVTAAAVAGSSFKGRGDHRVEPTQLLRNAHEVFSEVASHRKDITAVEQVDSHSAAFTRDDDRAAAANTYLVHLDDGTSFSVRLSVAPLEGQTVARTVMNPTKQGASPVRRSNAAGGSDEHVEKVLGRYVIQLSNKMDEVHVRRAVAHEVAEILARRELVLQNRLPGTDALHPGSTGTEALSPHDHGRIAEINVLAHEAAQTGPAAEHAQRELAALVEELGLREGVEGADGRTRKMADELTKQAHDALDTARKHDSKLSASERVVLEHIRSTAVHDRAEQRRLDETRQPKFKTPEAGMRVDAAKLAVLREQAHDIRKARGGKTMAKLRAEIAAGRRPKVRDPQIGGNAALAARNPETLLVDAGQRWHVDAGEYIAQTAHQLEGLKAAGFGDPYEFADVNGRVPVEALLYWQDMIAAQGDVIDGLATFGFLEDGTSLMTVHPVDGSAAIVVEVEGVPVIGTGFPKELAPGAPRDMTTRKALVALDHQLGKLESDPKLGTRASRARKALAELDVTAIGGRPLDNDTKASRALEILARVDADAAPHSTSATVTRSLVEALGDGDAGALVALKAQRQWADLRTRDLADGTKQLWLGDEANALTDEQVRAMRHVLIGGTGGTGVSAAEIVLAKNPTVHVEMLGKEAPSGLLENGQFRRLVENHGDQALAKRFHFSRSGDGRFEFQDGLKLGATEQTATGSYDPHATGADGKSIKFEGDTYIAALGRANDVPAAISEVVSAAERGGGTVKTTALFDDEEHYIGYNVTIVFRGKSSSFDVTGAASRFVDRVAIGADATPVNAASDHDAAAEGGNFDGGYVASGTQAARYARWRRQHDAIRDSSSIKENRR